MNSIQPEDIASLKVSSLPSRPTAPASFGGLGYTATDLKAAFDRLPLFLVEKINALITELNTVSASLLTIDGRVTVTETQAVTFQNRLTADETDITTLSGSVSSLASTTAGLNSRVTVNEAAITSLTAQITAALSSIQACNNRLTTAEGTIVSHTGRINAAESDIDNLQSASASLSAAISALSANVTTLGQSVTSLDSRVTALENVMSDVTVLDAGTLSVRLLSPISTLNCGELSERDSFNALILDAGLTASRTAS